MSKFTTVTTVTRDGPWLRRRLPVEKSTSMTPNLRTKYRPDHNWNYIIDCNGLGEQKSYNSRSIYLNLLVRNKVGLKKFVVQALTVLIWKSSFLSFLFVPFRPPSVSASVLASENASVVSPISVVCNPSILCTTVDRITTLTNWPVKLFFTRNSPFLERHIQRWNLLS